jgi:hypothetical protein
MAICHWIERSPTRVKTIDRDGSPRRIIFIGKRKSNDRMQNARGHLFQPIATARSKRQQLDLEDMGQRLHPGQRPVVNVLVNGDQRNSVAAFVAAARLHTGNIDPGIAQRCT